MKPIKLAAATLLSLASLAAQAGPLTLEGGTDGVAILPVANEFAGDVNSLTFNVGGNLRSSFAGSFDVTFTFLGKESAWTNTFKVGSDTLSTSSAVGASFTKHYDLNGGDVFGFDFLSAQGGGFVSNGSNSSILDTLSFATLLLPGPAEFKGVDYAAILFFDDTGGDPDDDNHDDLVIGVSVDVPEPSSIALLMSGLVGMFAARRRLKA